MKTYEYNNQTFSSPPKSVVLEDETRFYFAENTTDEQYVEFGFTLSEVEYTTTTPAPPLEKTLAEKEHDLWYACNKYQMNQISGAAVAMLAVGIIVKLPRALAVTMWIQNLWTGPNGYYARKALLTTDSNPNTDFSEFGTIPFSVPQLNEELSSVLNPQL